jgi:hypothetical protein
MFSMSCIEHILRRQPSSPSLLHNETYLVQAAVDAVYVRRDDHLDPIPLAVLALSCREAASSHTEMVVPNFEKQG